MSASLQPSHDPPPRRVVLIDFDWRDADLLPELVRRPELSVRLVAGQQPDDPGLRIAELCGLPRTLDLADLTREIFDLALVSERSTRRTQVEGLFQVLGTPCITPESFLGGEQGDEAPIPAVEATPALHAAALEGALGGSFEAVVEQALPDLTAPPGPSTAPRPAPAEHLDDLGTFPSLEDRKGLETALAQMVTHTGATVAEVRAGRSEAAELVVRIGDDDDPLLTGLVELAIRLDAPQVVSRLSGPSMGRAWGAWPFHTAGHHGVVAAGGIHPAEGWTAWEQMVEELRHRWDERDRAQAGPAFPLVPEPQSGWLDARAFRVRLELATQRHRRDGLRFAVHRVTLGDDAAVFEHVGARLPEMLRDTDSLCRIGTATVLLLAPHAPRAWEKVRGRILTLHAEAWRALGREGEPPEPVEDRIELVEPEGETRFLETATAWLAG